MLLLQEAVGKTWVLYDMGLLAAMLICLVTYSVYIQSLVDFQPQDTYEVYDSLGGAQARLLLPKKKDPTTSNGQHLQIQHETCMFWNDHCRNWQILSFSRLPHVCGLCSVDC